MFSNQESQSLVCQKNKDSKYRYQTPPKKKKKNLLQYNVCSYRVLSTRAEEPEEMSYLKEQTSASEPTQIQLGLL